VNIGDGAVIPARVRIRSATLIRAEDGSDGWKLALEAGFGGAGRIPDPGWAHFPC